MMPPRLSVRRPSNGAISPRKSPPKNTYFAPIFRCTQFVLYLLGLTYLVVVLLPLVQHYHSILSSSSTTPPTPYSSKALSLGDWMFHRQQRQKGYTTIDHPNIPQKPQFPTTFTGIGSAAATPTNTNASSSIIQSLPPILQDRKLAIVHIGKAGGVSLRRLTVVFCKLFFRAKKFDGVRAARIQKCVDKHFPDQKAALTHRTQLYFHLEEYNETELRTATSFLVTLRNPVDRIVSTYRYSHPGNCNDGNRNQVWRPRGCEAERHRNKTGLIQNDLYFKCFPSPAMEAFAQSLLRPWRKRDLGDTNTTTAAANANHTHNHYNQNNELSQQERRHCRYLAREVVQGYGTYGSGPHMLYNYAYYATRSIWRYPEKEVFAIRTEHEWQDMLHLDKLLGGNGNLKENRDVSHGSEGYVPSPLSPEAYQKLCCALEQEIEVYQDILNRVLNLSIDDKRAAMENVRAKCGITTSWTEWRVKCRRNWRRDLRALQPSLVINETHYPGHKTGYRATLLD